MFQLFPGKREILGSSPVMKYQSMFSLRRVRKINKRVKVRRALIVVEANLKQRKISQEVNHHYRNQSPLVHSLFSIVISFMKRSLITHNRILNLNQEKAHCPARNKRINAKKKVIKSKENVALRAVIPNVDDILLPYFHYFIIKCIFIITRLILITFC